MVAKRLSILLCVLVLLTGWSIGEAPSLTQDLVFPYVIFGNGWECDITIVNQGSETSSGTLNFFNNVGLALPVVANGQAPRSSVPFELLKQTSETFKLSGTGDLTSGFARVVQDSESDHGAIGGLITFRYVINGIPVQQVGVRAAPLLYSGHIPFDNTGTNQTAVAVMSPNREPVTLYRYDRWGQKQDRFQLNFKYWQSNLLAAFVGEVFPGTRFQEGFIRVEAPKGAYFLVLNQNNLILSTGDSLAGVIERQLTVQMTSSAEWTVRLVQQGDLLFGIAQKEPDGSPAEFVTGSFSGGTFHLSLSHRAEGLEQDRNCVLVGSASDLDSVAGVAALVSAEGVLESGTFQLTRPEGASY